LHIELRSGRFCFEQYCVDNGSDVDDDDGVIGSLIGDKD
jgi:hypothetical protein